MRIRTTLLIIVTTCLAVTIVIAQGRMRQPDRFGGGRRNRNLSSYRQRGIGSSLMKKADEFAESLGMDKIFLETQADNFPALALFRKFGYQLIDSDGNSLRLEKKLKEK